MQEVGGYGELVWTLIGSAGRIVRVVGSGSEGFVSGTLKHWGWIGWYRDYLPAVLLDKKEHRSAVMGYCDPGQEKY